MSRQAVPELLKVIVKTLLAMGWGLKQLVGLPPRSPRETFARLSWAVKRQPRYTAGKFRFPFGTIEYVDGLSLKWQYWEIFVQGGYDFQCRSESPTIIDCGGNIGLSVIRFKELYPHSQITVFEADPDVAHVLSRNLKSLDLTDVKIVNAAAWIEAGLVNFFKDGADTGSITDDRAGEAVEAIRLADFITHPVDLLKLDIEGAEYETVRDLWQTGKLRLLRRLVCEIHGKQAAGTSLGPMLEALADCGFHYVIPEARSAPEMTGEEEATPFSAVPDGKFLLHLYAWQPCSEE